MNSTWSWWGKYSDRLHPLEMHLSLVSSVTAVKIVSQISDTSVHGSGYPKTFLSPLPGRAEVPHVRDIFFLCCLGAESLF